MDFTHNLLHIMHMSKIYIRFRLMDKIYAVYAKIK